MSRILITAAMVTELPAAKEAPAEIVFLPEGKHQLTPKSHPKGISVNLPPERGEAVAAAFNADLGKRGAVKGWCDFEHSRKHPVSGYPTAFRYQLGVGIMASMDWSRSGRTAVEGRDVRYFSPEFFVGPDGVPNGLPERGPLGGLVTEPAFREIGAIAASADIDNDDTNAMSKFLILASIGLLTENEAASDGAEELARKRVTAMRADTSALDTLRTTHATLEKEHTGLKDKVTAAETAAKEAATKRADDLVTAAITDGRIAAKDEDTAKGFRERIAAGDAFAEKMLLERPKLNGDLGKTVVQASQGEGKKEEKKEELSGRDLVRAALAEESEEKKD